MKRCAVLVTAIVLVAVLHGGAGTAASPTPWIVFAASPNGGNGTPQLVRVRSDGTGLRPITSGVRVAMAPSLSPNGQKVVFARLSSGLFLVNIDGSGLRRLTPGSADTFPVWSPDGKRIAFLRPKGNEFHLYVMTADGRLQHLLRRAPWPAGRPSWTPDARAIVAQARGALYKVDALTGRVLKRFGVELDLENSVAVPTLSPDGRTVAFVGRRPSPPDCERAACDVVALYLARLPSGRAVRYLDDIGAAGWSPDSRTLVFGYRGGVALRQVESGAIRTIDTGTNLPSGDSPPTMQPR